MGPLLTENKIKPLISEGLTYHINKSIPLFETVYRIGSEKHLELIKEARSLYSRNLLDLCEGDEELIHSDLGEMGIFEDEEVPLGLPMVNKDYLKSFVKEIIEAEFKGKKVSIGKPKRGGPKAYYVYVKDPKTKKVKKVTFGSGGLRAKINDKKARNAFAKRHKCSQKKDKTKASYWSCTLPRYAKLLGLKSNFGGFW